LPWARQTTRPKGLGPAPCHTQQTWVRRPFPVISFLGLKKDVRPKLIITTTTTTIIIDFTLQIKSIYIFSIAIILISNLIIQMNLQ
jgi:hypothetical protein